MEKLARQLTSGIGKIQTRILSLLENEGVGKMDAEAPPFEVSRDIHLIDGLQLELPADLVDRAIVVFGRLAALFDAGILLEADGQTWIPRAQFSKGVSRSINSKITMTLPKSGPLTVLKAPAAPILTKLGLSSLDPENRLSATLIRPVPEFSYVLLSDLPDMWLKDHLEKVTQALAAGFAE